MGARAPARRRWRHAGLAALALGVAVACVGALRPAWVLEAELGRQRLAAGAERVERRIGDHAWASLEAGPADGRVVVLVHGFTGAKENWLPVMGALADAGFRVVAPDLPGWGASTRIAGADYGYRAQARRLEAYLALVGDGRPVGLVGHSMGGGIAALATAQAPDAVERLVLMSAAGVPFRENAFARAVLAGGHPFAVEDADALRGVLAQVFADPPWVPWPVSAAIVRQRRADLAFEREVLAAIGGPDAFAPGDAAGGITAPTLLLWCDGDAIVDPSAVDAWAERMPRARRLLLPGCGHMPMMERPAEVADALEDALR